MIGKKLKELLKIRGIRQIRLAEHLCISPSRLSNYLADKREPDLDMLARMAKFLDVDVNYFANMSATIHPESTADFHTNSPNTIDIPVKMLNAKKRSRPCDVIHIDKKLLNADVSDVLAVELTESIEKPLLLKGDYLLVCPISKRTPRHGDFIIIVGRHYKAYRIWMYKNEPFLVDFSERYMQKLSDIKDSNIYVMLLFIRRTKSD